MSALVYVHGTNGSGKSTLARAVLAAAGGADVVGNMAAKGKGFVTRSPALSRHVRPTVFLGKYDNACGGLDGYSPFANVFEVVRSVCDFNTFAEGLVTPGVETCQRLAQMYTEAHFIHLATPVEDCIAHVMQRRTRKGTTKPYDPANLYKKAQSAASWADRLERSGLEVHRLDYRRAYALSLDVLGLEAPDVATLLGD